MFKAIGVGFVAGGTVAGLLLLNKMRQINARGSALEAGMEQLGEQYANEVARQAADRIMGEVYGLTPERIAGAGRLVERLRPITSLF